MPAVVPAKEIVPVKVRFLPSMELITFANVILLVVTFPSLAMRMSSSVRAVIVGSSLTFVVANFLNQ